MRWLIVEDALRDRTGHWLEWVTTFARGFRDMDGKVTVLADEEVAPDIRESLSAEAILPRSIWHRMGDGSGQLTRYSRVFTHNWQTWRVMNRYLRHHPEYDAIFVPTVSVHHLLAWARLIKHTLRNRKTRVLLFFLHAPLTINSTGQAASDGSPSARLLISLLKWLGPEVRSGKVVLGVETKIMQEALSKLTGVPFAWFPQPVPPPVCSPKQPGQWIEMACFGAARAEKGSDVLQEAIRLHQRAKPASRARFTIQWVEDFISGGRTIVKSPELQHDSRVHFMTRYCVGGEYADCLRQTDVMLLPYRLSSYGLRGSRVVIEAAVNSIPVVTTRGSTLAEVAAKYGAGLECEDGNPQSLADAIAEMESRIEEMRGRAARAAVSAAELFSVKEFQRLFLASGCASGGKPDTVTNTAAVWGAAQ